MYLGSYLEPLTGWSAADEAILRKLEAWILSLEVLKPRVTED